MSHSHSLLSCPPSIPCGHTGRWGGLIHSKRNEIHYALNHCTLAAVMLSCWQCQSTLHSTRDGRLWSNYGRHLLLL